MSFFQLAHLAFNSFIEYAEDLLMVFLKMFIFLLFLLSVCIGNILYKKFISHKAILGWASTLSAELFNTALICIGFFVIGVLLLSISHKQNRNTRSKIFDKIDL